MELIVGVSGASGVVMSRTLLDALRRAQCRTHLVMTDAARRTWDLETDHPLSELLSLADKVYDVHDMAADISSGSFVTDGMIVLPCSMKTLAGIVSGYTDNLLLRAADVCLKENRRVVLCPRETPLGRIHLRNLLAASELGCAIVPPMLTFYNAPQTVQEQINHVVGKVLLQFGIVSEDFVPWEQVDQTENKRR